MAEPTFLGGNSPRRSDAQWAINQKILGAIRDAGSSGGGSASGNHYKGAGSPEGVVTGSVGDIYFDTTNFVVYFKMTGAATSTGWQ